MWENIYFMTSLEMQKKVAIIPARYKSSRFPGKPLAKILGKSLLQRTYENVLAHGLFDDIYIATDDNEIFQHAKSFNSKCIMTSEYCRSGTERIIEAIKNLRLNDSSIIVNIQGDHPCISSNTIKAVIDILENDSAANVSTAVSAVSFEEAQNPNVVKCVFDKYQSALYFSRSCIPFPKNNTVFYYHIGIYAYRLSFLKNYHLLPDGNLQCTEDLEQLKILENGYKIKVALVVEEELGVDVPQDIGKIENFFATKKKN